MPVPSTLADLDPVAANNSPPGSEAVGTNIDNYLRAGFAFIAQLDDNKLETTTAASTYQPLDSLLTSLAGQTTAANKVQAYSASDTALLLDFKDEDDMASDSATAIPSQQSVKAYVDNSIPNGLTSMTSQATTSGTAIDFTSIPSWVKRITIIFNEVSTNGTANLLVQIGDSGGIETTNYIASSVRLGDGAAVSVVSSTAGFVLNHNAATFIYSGHVVLTLIDAATFTWISSHQGKLNVSQGNTGGGSKSLSGTLDRVTITTANGTDAFDAGSINLLYE